MLMAQKIPTGYKQTEIGVIPADWDVKELGQVLKVRHGKSQKGITSVNGNFPILATGGEIGRTNQYLYNKPSVLIGRKGTINIPRYMETPFWTVDTLFYSEIEKNNDAKYLYYKFLLIDWYSYNEASGVPSLNAKTIEKIQASFPPTKAEQFAIATTLSDADTLIEKLEKLIEKKKFIKQGAMQELLTGKRRLSEFSGEWKEKKISDICGKITTGKLNANAMVEGGEYRFYTCAKDYYQIDRYAFDTEALLVSGNGANVGYIHYYKGKFNAYQRTYVLSDFSADIQYLKLFMDRNLQERIRVEVNAGNTPYITMGTLTEMQIMIPPTKDEQTAIATVLSGIDTEIEALEQKLAKYKMLKQGMMQVLLTGKVRLI